MCQGLPSTSGEEQVGSLPKVGNEQQFFEKAEGKYGRTRHCWNGTLVRGIDEY